VTLIAECDTKLARHRAALEAGADPATVTGWIADTNAQRNAAQAELRAADNQPHKALSSADIEDMIATLGGLVAILHDARPEDRHSIYDQLGIRLTSLGKLTSAEFWEATGVAGSADDEECPATSVAPARTLRARSSSSTLGFARSRSRSA
jgi:NAD kinase